MGIPTFAWLILDLRHVLAQQLLILKLLLHHNLFFVTNAPGPWLSQNLILGQPFQPLPGAGRKRIGQGHQLRIRIEPQNKPHALLVPAVQLGGMGEVGVAPHRDPVLYLAYQPNRPINLGYALAVAGSVAWSAHQIQHSARVG